MIRFLNNLVTFEEIPTEVSLSLTISNCRIKCQGCHSPELWCDVGQELTDEVMDTLIALNSGISCVLFLGEGDDRKRILSLAKRIKTYNKLNVALYSGRDVVEDEIYQNFDYVKIGRYDKLLGPLNKDTTNQRLYHIVKNSNGEFVKIDITKMFW